MRKTSWEIIVAGLLMLFVALIIVAKSDNDRTDTKADRHSKAKRSEKRSVRNDIKIIDLKGVSNLEKLEELENLGSLEGLENLKSLSSIISAEVNQKIIEDLNLAIEDLEGDSFSINIDLEDEIILLKKEYDINAGEWTEISTGVYAFKKIYNENSYENLSLKLSSGSIKFIGSDNPATTFTVNASGDIAARELLKDMVSIKESIVNKDLGINISSSNNSNNNIQLQTIVTVPNTVNIAALTGAGHIDVSNTSGDLEFKTSGGHIKLKRLSGEITAFTEGGHITIMGGEGDISLKSLGGHLRAVDTNGKLELRTSGGNIKAENITGSINAFTSGGNILVDVKELNGEIQTRNGAGQVELVLPAGADASFAIMGTKVELDTAFNFEGTRDNSSLNGTIGKGTYPIKIKTGYGTVTILKNE